eukprot:2100680-Amphidinium_carterae.1
MAVNIGVMVDLLADEYPCWMHVVKPMTEHRSLQGTPRNPTSCAFRTYPRYANNAFRPPQQARVQRQLPFVSPHSQQPFLALH